MCVRGTVFRLRAPVRGCSVGAVASTEAPTRPRVRGESHDRALIDAVAGTTVYINPAFVVSLRPDPAEPDAVSIVKLSDGETVRIRGDHGEAADELRQASA